MVEHEIWYARLKDPNFKIFKCKFKRNINPDLYAQIKALNLYK
jgi:hypothetical protein